MYTSLEYIEPLWNLCWYPSSELITFETMTFEKIKKCSLDILFSDMLSQEPPWSEGEICLECGSSQI